MCTALTPRDFCGAKVQNYAENLGEVLRGDRIESSAYKMKMKNDRYCEVLCEMDYTKCVLAFVWLAGSWWLPHVWSCAALISGKKLVILPRE